MSSEEIREEKPESAGGLSADAVRAVLAFRDARGWKPHHNPKDLALSIAIEAAELLECFQWSGADLECREKHDAAAAELGDILIYAILLADRLGEPLEDLLRRKLASAKAKYPADVCRSDPGLEHYQAIRANARAEAARDIEKAQLAARQASERAARLASHECTVLLNYREFLASHPAGAWTSASDGRVFFVAYDRRTVDFWQAADAFAAMFPPEALEKGLPEGFPRRPDTKAVWALPLEGIAAILKRIVRDERIHDGAFLSAAESGLIGEALAALGRFREESERERLTHRERPKQSS